MARTPGVRFIFVTLLLDIMGIGIVIPVLPSLVQHLLHTDEAGAARVYGLLVATYALLQTVFAPILGALSDRYGRRPVILIALTGMGLSYVLQAWAPSVAWLFVGRIFAGITGATITPANAYIADVSNAENRARNFGLVGVAFGVGFILGPAIGGLLGQLGPRIPFVAAAVMAMLSALWGIFVLPESLPPERRRASIDAWELVPLRGLANLRIHWVVSGLAGVVLLQALAQRGLESVWVLHGEYRYGWTGLQTGMSLALVGLTTAIVQGGLVRQLVPRLGEPRSLLLGLSINVVALVCYAFASKAWMVYAIIPFGAVGAIAMPAGQGLVVSVVDADRQGAVQGSLTSVQALSAVFGPLISTRLFAAGTEGALGLQLPGLPFLAGAGFVLLALVQGVVTVRRLEREGALTAGP